MYILAREHVIKSTNCWIGKMKTLWRHFIFEKGDGYWRAQASSPILDLDLYVDSKILFGEKILPSRL